MFVKKKTHNIIGSSSSKAKTLIILIWVICGYFLTLSYESVLRAMLMKTYYEKKIDSIDDVLATEREVRVVSGIWTNIMASDPRLKVRELATRTKTFTFDISRQDLGLEWLAKGYLLMIYINNEQSSVKWCLIFVHFSLHNLTYIHITPKISVHQGNDRQFFAEKYGKTYASKEKLYARHRGFLIPKASPLEASYYSLLCKENILIHAH